MMILRSIFVTLTAFCVAFGQPPRPRAFEVAAIKPMELGGVMMGFSSSGPRLTLEGYNQFLLIKEAFNLKNYQLPQVAALQDDRTYYFITAKAEGDGTPTKAEFREMLQTLLTERFNLKFHREVDRKSVV